ncbi:hypothetical protein [Desertihabitans aurantiacus]|uniref:hypothetical protein n=1 Tax=Desertihabitans aurantiacus TaxID=2282477 RepID=UPI000DF78294|nr:hypothetical protein [Desertihabitans aurantiacus]
MDDTGADDTSTDRRTGRTHPGAAPAARRWPPVLLVPAVAGLATLVVMVVRALGAGAGDVAPAAALFVVWNLLPWVAAAVLVLVVHRREPLTTPVLWFGTVLLAVLAGGLITAALVSGDAQAGIVFAVLPVYLLLGLVLLLALALVIGVGRRRSRTR